MDDMTTSMPELSLVRPDPERDAPFAVEWFKSKYGKETLRLMGNADSEIGETSLEREIATIEKFLELKKSGKQLTWAIRYQDKTVGAVWIELHPTKHVKAPALHIMIGDHGSRGKGIGRVVMGTIIAYIKDTLKSPVLYSRHLADNLPVRTLNDSLGFVQDGEPYTDDNGLIFQNVKLVF